MLVLLVCVSIEGVGIEGECVDMLVCVVVIIVIVIVIIVTLSGGPLILSSRRVSSTCSSLSAVAMSACRGFRRPWKRTERREESQEMRR